jgi:hypothetical protein
VVVTLTVRNVFHVPPPIPMSPSSTHLLHRRDVPRNELTARLTQSAFRGCDDEHPQAQRRVGVRLPDPAGRGARRHSEGPSRAGLLLHQTGRKSGSLDRLRPDRRRWADRRGYGDRGPDEGALRSRHAPPCRNTVGAAGRRRAERGKCAGGDPAGRAVQGLRRRGQPVPHRGGEAACHAAGGRRTAGRRATLCDSSGAACTERPRSHPTRQLRPNLRGARLRRLGAHRTRCHRRHHAWRAHR